MGDKKAWPLYLSIGNIDSRIRNSRLQNAWVLLGYIPVVHFDDNADIQTVLSSRLFHQCARVILSPLYRAGTKGVRMVDAVGHVRKCFPLAAAYLADYPEQILVNVAAGNNSPVTLAGYHELDNLRPSPPRTREWILETIDEINHQVDPRDIQKYLRKSVSRGLNGVNDPFWKYLPGYQPELTMSPDILHGLHRFWRDHMFKWIKRLVGEEELDRRLKVLQPVVGFKAYPKGIRHMTQWTGREDRELQRIIIPVIAGAKRINARAMRSIRAFHDFIYLAQYRSHSTKTLQRLSRALKTFHQTKAVFIQLGARAGEKGPIDHFRIPKMAGLHVYATHIPEMGSSPQYSTETTEACHQPMAKNAYKATNHKDFVVQMCRWLDRNERLRFKREFIAWARLEIPRLELKDSITAFSPRYQAQAMNTLKQQQEEELKRERGRKLTPKRGLWLTKSPTHIYKDWLSLGRIYKLPNLQAAVNDFLGIPSHAVSFQSVSLGMLLMCFLCAYHTLIGASKCYQHSSVEKPSNATSYHTR